MDLGNQDLTSSKMSKYEKFAKSFKKPTQLGSGIGSGNDTGKFSMGRSIQNPFAKKSMGMDALLKQSVDLKPNRESENLL